MTNLYQIFDQDGLLNKQLKHFEYREDQLKMALDVQNAFENNQIACIEAGTGIGKSFAYLVPSLSYAFDDPEDRTVIATSTINLQKQLIDKDIPALFKAFGKECKVEIAVGRNNYLCLRRLENEMQSMPLFEDAEASELGRINEFANNTTTGLRTDYEGKLDYSIWTSVCSDGDFCMGGKCPFYQQCFYFKAKKQLAEASIIICNHHLLFVDSNSRMEGMLDYTEDCILPPFNRLVIDEAHNIERHATDLFTIDYSSNGLIRQIDYVYETKWKGLRGPRLLEDLLPFCNDKNIYEDIVNFIHLVISGSDTLNLAMLNLLEVNRIEHVLLTKENFEKVFADTEEIINSLNENILRLLGKLNTFVSKLLVPDDKKQNLEELKVHIGRIKQIQETLKTFVNYKDWNDDVHYLEIVKKGQNKYVYFKIAPIEVSNILREALFKKIDSVICTSATLDLHDNFAYWSSSIGLPVATKTMKTSVYKSPFDYKNRLMLLTPYDALDFNKDKQDEYAQFLCSSVYEAVASSGGGALVLFTSVKLMNYVFESVKPRLEVLDIQCLKQGEMDRYALLEKFKDDKDSVLFATDSFWEGVDAPGDTLRLVIITKLPFRMPDEPIYKARYRKMEAEGKSAFYQLSLPDAAMRLKQGFGRLMRHTEDKGIVLILDSRIVSSSYGNAMLSILPESYYPESTVKTVNEKIENFLF